jgi:BirA family biotin operon repressor/biotin-[acetyl-CoA-carboxylase] ligase
MTSWQAFHFDSVDSTNDVAKRLIQDDQIHGRAYIVAREQTAGRGQRGRPWLSPRDAGIYLTTVDFPNALPTPVTNLFTLGAGIACVEALRQCAGVDIHLKPINDLYAGHAKLGGILTEAVIEREYIKALLIGIGINVRRTPRPLPAESPEAISLQDLIPPAQFWCVDEGQLVIELVDQVFLWNTVVASGDTDRVKREWERYKLSCTACTDEPI